ncbi:hypothetical protein [Zoogloea sp.]|uniref:hypothetical protein n=1 Tax=Zoogloea sp. TaxID=49181 RepID=UPI0035B22251
MISQRQESRPAAGPHHGPRPITARLHIQRECLLLGNLQLVLHARGDDGSARLYGFVPIGKEADGPRQAHNDGGGRVTMQIHHSKMPDECDSLGMKYDQ